MEVKWTQSQAEAIESRGRDLLVSAAAGSGKTAVLTARIISRLTDAENPVEISRILAVTFTKAAAAELKERISKALYKTVKADPKNKVLARQILLLNQARISTIHSFCYNVVKNNFHVLGLNANIRIADDMEIQLIYNDVMNRTIEYFYNTPPDEMSSFEKLVETFVTTRDDNLNDTFIKLYKKLKSYPDGLEFIIKNTGDKWVETFCRITERQLNYFKRAYEMALDYMSDEGYIHYRAAFVYDYKFICELLKNLDYDSMRTLLQSYEKQTLDRRLANNLRTDELNVYKEIRDDFRKMPEKIYNDFFGLSNEQIENAIEKTASINKDIYLFLKEFEKRLNAEKLRRGILDFADLEQLTYNLLYRGGKLTDSAYSIREQFDEIYIDEYQDVNLLQDEIFKAIAKPNGRFMVGDIKQSIYKFRGAKPNIFNDYRENYPANTIFLSENFRCDETIIDFTNIVMGRLFRNNSGNVNYESSDDLIFSKATDKPNHKVEVSLLADSESEADYVCQKVTELLAEGYSYKDITLLFRSLNHATVFEEKLNALKIPYYVNTSRGFFENAEILLIMCLLNCIDNPARDIYLMGILKSPLFNVTLDELIDIRGEAKYHSLYDSLREYTEKNSFKKGEYFLSKLNQYRTFAECQPIDKLIWYIYRDTNIMAYVDDKTQRANLLTLYDYARKFESGSFKGLYNFILYVNDLIKEEVSPENAKAFDESGDTIKIMTIHQSKGLEFPVCFICDTSREINKRDVYASLLVDDELGIAMKLRDETGYAYYDTPLRQAMVLQILENNIDEEMRILYVAMTRARKRLIITANDDKIEKLQQDCMTDAEFMSPYVFAVNPAYIKWILTALYNHGDDECYMINCIDEIETVQPTEAIQEVVEIDNGLIEDYKSLIKKRFDFKYPHTNAVKLPAKLSVSELHRSYMREDDEVVTVAEPDISDFTMPKFMSDVAESTTPAERGTATHVFMQFCDFAHIEKKGIEAEIARLVAEKFINERDAGLINKTQIKRFFASQLYYRMNRAEKVWRETRFNIKYPAGDEYILVQGVIDCFFLERGKLILVDYKTDACGKDTLIERHSAQLSYYKTACKRLTGLDVFKTYIYSFHLNDSIELL